jgi:hypothetical protein
LAIVLSGSLAFTISAALSLFGTFPQPGVHDEFSYLLAADTFAHGRLSNPPHPLWVHFESIHILQQPTYASKYPPAQGLILALGQVVTGHAIVGAWLGASLASAALCWMLQAWLRPRWAALGGFLAALHPMMIVWSQSYWGGAIAVCGGALVLGAVRRLADRPRGQDAFWLGLGMAVLANSRPFEGLVLTLLALPLLRPTWRTLQPRLLVPVTVVLALTAGAMGFYNWRVTGHFLRMPHVAHETAYAVAPPFVWQATRPTPDYRHKELRELHLDSELAAYEQQRSMAGLLAEIGTKLATLFHGSVSLLLLQLALAALPWILRDPWMKRALLILGLFLLAILQETWMHPHYAAPAAGLVMVVCLQALRHLRLWRWRGRPAGRFLVRAGLLMSVALLIPFCAQLSQAKGQGWAVERARLLEELKQQGGRHLVLVRYSAGHSPHAEWVYNEAGIDQAAVVWAQEMTPEQNRELLEYFKDRQCWLVQADAEPPRLLPYSGVERQSLEAGQTAQ